MSNDPKRPDQPPKDDAPETTGGEPKGQAEQQAPREEFFFTDHTPPPITIGGGSIIVETDREFDSRDANGPTAHRFRHMFNGGRSVQGWRILTDAGDTVDVVGKADQSSIKIWYKNKNGAEQILVDGSSLTIEADANLGNSISITHPPIKRTVRREKQYKHPASGGPGVEIIKVVVTTRQGLSKIYETTDRIRLDKVMIWDIPHVH